MTRSKRRSGTERRRSKKRTKKTPERKTDPGSRPPASRPSFALSLLLTTLSGCLYFLAFPGFDLWPLAFVALVPLFVALDARPAHSTKRAVLLGVVFGLVTNLGGYYWLVGMLQDFSGFPLLLCLLFAIILCTYQGGLLAVFAWLYHRASGRGWQAVLVAPLAFGAAELVYPLLFQSYYAAHFHDLPAMIQVVDLGGPILLSMVAVAVNAALYQVGRALWQREKPPWKAPTVAFALLAATLIYGAVRIPQVDARTAEAPSLTVGMVQVSMGIFAKREDPHEGLRRHIGQSLELEREHQPDLLVWPESAYTYFLPEGASNVGEWVMGPLETPILFGGLMRRTVDGDERHYNTAVLIDETGEIQGTYDKTYLLAFGEYLPFGDTFPILYDWSPHSGRFTPGSHVQPLHLGDYRISALVCYEDIIPGFVREAVAEADPHLLVNMTNDAWFGDTSEPWQHLALAKFRAVEHHRYLVRSTNSGVSAIVDPVGRTVGEIGVMERGNLYGEVRVMTGWTPYQTLGDWPGWLALAGILVLAFWKRRT